MDDLIAFIKARLDEDERIARAVTPDDWGDSGEWARHEWEDLPDAAFTHAKHHDPARVLREVAAMRAILAMYENELLPTKYAPDPEVQEMLDVRKDLLEDVVQTLADAWSDHADYRQEWAP